jgi:predicted DNA-binding protein
MSQVLEMSKDEIQTSLRMSRDLLRRLKQYALDHDISLATVVREACEDYLASYSKKEKSFASKTSGHQRTNE